MNINKETVAQLYKYLWGQVTSIIIWLEDRFWYCEDLNSLIDFYSTLLIRKPMIFGGLRRDGDG